MYLGSYTCLTEHILILRILYLCYRAYSCISELILVFRTLYLYYRAYTCTKVSVGTTHIHYTEVPVGTTRLIFILQNLYFFYRYGNTSRYYRDFTCTEVLVGTTEQI